MTKKDYELIGTSIANFVQNAEKLIGDNYDLKTVLYLTGWLAQDLGRDNSKFNTKKFTDIVTKTVKKELTQVLTD
jgi:hypothetical protein